MWEREVALDITGYASGPIARVIGQQALPAVKVYQQAKGPATDG